MTAKEFLESKGIETLTVKGFQTPNIGGTRTFYTAFSILEEYARLEKIKILKKIADGTYNIYDQISYLEGYE